MFLENTINHAKQSGWMEVICGSMFSGKTEELIHRIGAELKWLDKSRNFQTENRYSL